jgi:hypothetical protein
MRVLRRAIERRIQWGPRFCAVAGCYEELTAEGGPAGRAVRRTVPSCLAAHGAEQCFFGLGARARHPKGWCALGAAQVHMPTRMIERGSQNFRVGLWFSVTISVHG